MNPDAAINTARNAIEVRKLSRHFKNSEALCDVDLDVPNGSVFGLIGLNGAGKTTLIHHLIGALKPQSGSVSVLGLDPVKEPVELLRRVGYMTEEDSLPSWMSVQEMIDFSRAIYSTWDDAYATQLCEMFQLLPQQKLKRMSKGQRARVALLVAIAHRPELLILDEPSSGLDPIARSDILEAIIRTVSRDGGTVLFSSHLLEEVQRVCDWVAILHAGAIVQSLPIDDIANRFLEVTFVVQSPVDLPQDLETAFGWQQNLREWSVIVEQDEWQRKKPSDYRFANAVSREATLQRWFAGQVTQRTTPDFKQSQATELTDV